MKLFAFGYGAASRITVALFLLVLTMRLEVALTGGTT